jgi:hypothetical protein
MIQEFIRDTFTEATVHINNCSKVFIHSFVVSFIYNSKYVFQSNTVANYGWSSAVA